MTEGSLLSKATQMSQSRLFVQLSVGLLLIAAGKMLSFSLLKWRSSRFIMHIWCNFVIWCLFLSGQDLFLFIFVIYLFIILFSLPTRSIRIKHKCEAIFVLEKESLAWLVKQQQLKLWHAPGAGLNLTRRVR